MAIPLSALCLYEVHSSNCARFNAMIALNRIWPINTSRNFGNVLYDWAASKDDKFSDFDEPCICNNFILRSQNVYWLVMRGVVHEYNCLHFVYAHINSITEHAFDLHIYRPRPNSALPNPYYYTSDQALAKYASRGAQTKRVTMKGDRSVDPSDRVLRTRVRASSVPPRASRVYQPIKAVTPRTSVGAEVKDTFLQNMFSFIPQLRPNNHIGDHSIVPVNVTEATLAVKPPRVMNIWSVIKRVLTARIEVGVILVNGVGISCTNFIPSVADAIVAGAVNFHFIHTHGLNIPALINTGFTFSPPIEVARYQINDAAIMLTMNTFQPRSVGNVLRSKFPMSRAISESIAASFDMNIILNDMSSLFVLCAFAENIFHWSETIPMALVVPVMPVGAILTINLATEGAAAAAVMNDLHNSIRDGTITFPHAQLTTEDYSLLYLLCSGTHTIQLPVAPVAVIRALSFQVPALNFAVWHPGDIVLPNAVQLTAQSIAFSSQKLANLLHCQDAYVRGFTRAQMYTNNLRIPEQNDVNGAIVPQSRLLFSTLELSNIELPQPRACNWLWALLDFIPAYPEVSVFRDEWVSLTGLVAGERLVHGAIVAALFTTSLSTLLHMFNITGFDISVYANAGAFVGEDNTNYILPQLTTLLDTTRDNILIAYHGALSILSQYTEVSIHPNCLYSRSWCGNKNIAPAISHDNAWRVAWMRHVPYVLNVLVINTFVKTYLSVWGFSAPGLAFDTSAEVQVLGMNQGWRPALGEAKYNQVCQSTMPFQYVTYGAMIFNAIAQHYRLANFPVVQFHSAQAANNTVVLDPVLIVDPQRLPVYFAPLHSIVPGTIVTYDWQSGVNLQPYIPAANVGANLFAFLRRTGHMKSAYAGIYADVGVANIMPPLANPNVFNAFGMFGDPQPAPVPPNPAAGPEN